VRRVLASFALLLTALAAAGTGPFAPEAYALDGSERALIGAINQAREARGLAALRYEPRLARIAEGYAEASAAGAPANHPALDVAGRMSESAYPYLTMQAFAEGGSDDPVAQAETWLADPQFRRPILSSRYEEIGVGRIAPPRVDGAGVDGAGAGGIEAPVWGVVLATPTAPAPAGWGRAVLEEVNRFRARHGLIPLSRNRQLDRAAQGHADDMARRDFFAHRTPEGVGPAERVDRSGYHWSTVLENLAAGQPSAREVVQGWIASKAGHREAMLDKTVREVGIGYVYVPRANGRVPVQHFWAMVLAAPQ
jgi:uncharacterized protein YkwD